MTRAIATVLVLFLVVCRPVFAQDSPPAADTRGLVAGLALGGARVKVGATPDTRSVWNLSFGYRVGRDAGWLNRVRLTPQLELMATNLRGVDIGSQPFAYASLETSLRLSARMATRLRVFGDISRGLVQTAEVPLPDTRILNYSGSGGRGWAVGFEIPITPQGRGIEVRVHHVSGRFSQYEYQHDITAADMLHSATSVFVGWSGRFTGISLPWR